MPTLRRTVRGTKSLPPEARPRERCLASGAEALSEVELISLLLGTGRAGEDVQQVAAGALAAFGSLERLAKASAREITALPGFGPARAAMLKAAFELGRRKASREGPDTPLDSSRAAAALLIPWLSGHREERFVVLCLDAKQRLLRKEEVFKGTLTSTLVHPREVFAIAIREGAASILVAHNHPSGDPSPSDEDLAITKRLEEAGRLIGIHLTDHLIIGHEGFLSLRAVGLMGR